MNRKFYIILPLFISLNLSCSEKIASPEEVVREWVGYIQQGECRKALWLEIEIGMAEPDISDCEPYAGEIKSITCDAQEEYAECTCYELINSTELLKNVYNLHKVDGVWKMHIHH